MCLNHLLCTYPILVVCVCVCMGRQLLPSGVPCTPLAALPPQQPSLPSIGYCASSLQALFLFAKSEVLLEVPFTGAPGGWQ